MMQTTLVKTDGLATTTGLYMREMVERYYLDMAPYAHLTLSELFDFVKNLPFRPDPDDCETLMRPLYTISMRGTGGDCDDKSIVIASWARLHSIPYRFVAVRRADRPVLHHVFPQLYIGDRWISADATYNFNTLGRERESYIERTII